MMLRLTDNSRRSVNERISELRNELDIFSLDKIKSELADVRDLSKKYDIRRFICSDFTLLRDYERILSDSITVSKFCL